MKSEVIAFLGPTLDAEEAQQLGPLTVLPPARQGDVWRALELGPRALVLIDGVFEAQPSVWHAELLSALDAGVAVYGASSMGALRAVELAAFGMRGVGKVYEQYASGELVDDAEVALLHASAEHRYRALTVPLVNVRYAAAEARRERVLTVREAGLLVRVAEETFYQERRWPSLDRALVDRWSAATLGKWRAFASRGLPDSKREDALTCLKEALRWAASGRRAPRLPRSPVGPSSLVRRRRLFASESNARAMQELVASRSSAQWSRDGLIRSVLATTARAMGLKATAAELQAVERAWRTRLGARGEDAGFCRQMGMDAGDVRRLCEDEVLAEKLLEVAPRALPDALSFEEALANEARWQGAWPKVPGRKRRA